MMGWDAWFMLVAGLVFNVTGILAWVYANKRMAHLNRKTCEHLERTREDARVFTEFSELWTYGARQEARDLMRGFMAECERRLAEQKKEAT